MNLYGLEKVYISDVLSKVTFGSTMGLTLERFSQYIKHTTGTCFTILPLSQNQNIQHWVSVWCIRQNDLTKSQFMSDELWRSNVNEH